MRQPQGLRLLPRYTGSGSTAHVRFGWTADIGLAPYVLKLGRARLIRVSAVSRKQSCGTISAAMVYLMFRKL
jgi:hypothetical protein